MKYRYELYKKNDDIYCREIQISKKTVIKKNKTIVEDKNRLIKDIIVMCNDKAYICNHNLTNIILEFDDTTIKINDYKKIISRKTRAHIINNANEEVEAVASFKPINKKLLKDVVRGLFISGIIVVGLNYLVKKDEKEEFKNIPASIETVEETKDDYSGVDYLIDKVDLPEVIEVTIEKPSDFETINSYLNMFKTRINDDNYNNVVNEYNNIIEEMSFRYGLDPELVRCVAAQERGKHSNSLDKGGAVGLMQIQYNHHVNEKYTVFNYENNSYETFTVTDSSVRSLEGNIKLGVAILQNNLDRYEGNIFLALQAYNFGPSKVNKIIDYYSNEMGISKKDMLNDVTNLYWVNEIDEVVKNNYGDHNYLNHVFSRYNKDSLTVKYRLKESGKIVEKVYNSDKKIVVEKIMEIGEDYNEESKIYK